MTTSTEVSADVRQLGRRCAEMHTELDQRIETVRRKMDWANTTRGRVGRMIDRELLQVQFHVDQYEGHRDRLRKLVAQLPRLPAIVEAQ